MDCRAKKGSVVGRCGYSSGCSTEEEGEGGGGGEGGRYPADERVGVRLKKDRVLAWQGIGEFGTTSKNASTDSYFCLFVSTDTRKKGRHDAVFQLTDSSL